MITRYFFKPVANEHLTVVVEPNKEFDKLAVAKKK